LAHTTPSDDLWSSSFAERLTAAHMALTPTLTLWDVEAKKGNTSPEEIEKGMSIAAQQLKAFSQAGGQILFGTDVGYIERLTLRRNSLGCPALVWASRTFWLRSPQIPPNVSVYLSHSGRIAKGMDADLVVLSADPAKSITAFAQVRYTIRDGKIIYSKK